MGLTEDKTYGEILKSQIDKSTQYFDSWKNKFQCEKLEDYYDGFQWEGLVNDPENHYTLNMIFSTFQIKRPTLLFKKPVYYASPKPARANFDTGAAGKISQLASDTLNTFAMSDTLGLAEESEAAILDAGSYFGMMEVGFDATWASNPNAGRPVLDEKENPVYSDGKILEEPDEIPQEEWVYVKRIDPARFRVSLPDQRKLSQHKWVAYYDYVLTDELQDSRIAFKNIDQLVKVTHKGAPSPSTSIDSKDEDNYSGYNKIWKVWHNFEKMHYWVDDVTGLIIFEQPFERLPLFPLRFHKRRNGFYPIPYFFNWISPQDEINEVRDQMRYVRRRAKRIWLSRKGAFHVTEMDKLLTGPSEQVVETENDPQTALWPVQSPALDSAILNAFPTSKDDFNIISGTGAEARGQADRVTATQAQIMDTRSTIREADEKEVIAQWYCEIGREILNLVVERMTLPFWVQINQDLGAWGEDVTEIQEQWKLIEAQELEGLDFKLNFSIQSLSPIAQDRDQKTFLNFLAVISQYPMLSLNPDLIRETAYRLDYRNEKVILAMQQAAQLHMMGQMANQGAQQGSQAPVEPPTNMGQRTAEQMMPPDQAQIENQIAAQGVPSG